MSNKKNKINGGKFVLFLLIITISLGILTTCLSPEYTEIEIDLIDLSLVQDGKFNGEYEKGIIAEVDVIMNNNRIISIDLLKHVCSPAGLKGEFVIKDVIETQSNVVDAVSGATASSLVILKAIEISLKKGIP